MGLCAGWTVLAGGCGAVAHDPTLSRKVAASACGGDAQRDDAIPDVVVLDWTGGISLIYPDEVFDGVDLASFETDDGFTLATDPPSFMRRVREGVQRIFCDRSDVAVHVINGEDDARQADTVVHIIQNRQPGDGGDIGEGDYDPCNVQGDNAAIVFGEALRLRAGVNTTDEWVTIFANVCAHEIGHTLGFGHVSRKDEPNYRDDAVVELMLDGHTLRELRQPQRFVVPQTNCPTG